MSNRDALPVATLTFHITTMNKEGPFWGHFILLLWVLGRKYHEPRKACWWGNMYPSSWSEVMTVTGT